MIDDVQSGKYDVIGMSVTHVNMSIDLNMLIKLNNSLPIGKDAIFVLGGQEATLNYKQWLESGVADICFLGFAEYTFSKFCYSIGKYINKFHNNKGHLHKDIIHILQNLDGVAYIDKFNINNNAVYNPSKALTKDEFTDLFYDRAINIRVPYERYWSIIGAKKKNEFNNADFTIKTARLYTVSHCPRRCGFCSSQSFIPESQNKKSSIIMLTAYQVYDLVERYVKDYSVQAFLFSDDDFPVGNREGLIRLKDFCDLIIDAKNNDILPDSLNFFCQARALDFIKRGSKERVVSIDLLKKMSNAGFKNIGLGIETFSDRLLHKPSVNKLGVNSSDYNIVIDSMLKLGIVPQMFIIIGIPESTISDVMLSIKKSASYVMKGADMAVISTMRAYPGSPVLLNNKYRVSTTPWDNKEKNIRIKILDYFIPSNQTIAAIINKIDPAVIEEQNKLKLVMNWDEGVIVSKSLVAMTQFIAVSKLLEQFDIANDLYKKLYKSLGFSRVQIEKFISLEGHNF